MTLCNELANTVWTLSAVCGYDSLGKPNHWDAVKDACGLIISNSFVPLSKHLFHCGGISVGMLSLTY